MKHPLQEEELMAYLDGELQADRAAGAAQHLESCQECRQIAAELRGVTSAMMAWQIEPREDNGSDQISPVSSILTEALNEAVKNKRPARPRRIWPWAWGAAGAVAVALAMVSLPRLARAPAPQSAFARREVFDPPLQQFSQLQAIPQQGGQQQGGQQGQGRSPGALSSGAARLLPQPQLPAQAMIEETAELTIVTKEFDKARSALDDILKRHGGYMGQLNATSPAEAGKSLNAALRVPSNQLEPAIAEIKKLGRLETERRMGEDVTAQYVDLEARLDNARNTEHRLTSLLDQRTGKLSDVLSVEQEIDRVRGEIERMEAERKALSNRVDFATLNVTIEEEYRAQLQAAPDSLSGRFRNAAVDGYQTMIQSLAAVAFFLLSAGPSVLLWGALLFFPARFLWKKIRPRLTFVGRG